jgi:two-component system OmpR family sensor kinase
VPIRWRLTLWFSLVLLVILLFSGFILYFILQSYLYDTIDNNLKTYNARVQTALSQTAASGPLNSATILSQLPPLIEFSSPATYLELIDPTGKVLVKSENLGSQDLPVDPSLIEKGIGGQTNIQNVAAGGGIDVRIMVSPLSLSDQTLVLEVAQATQPVTDALQQFRLALIISTLTALALTAVSGAILIGITLRPVKRITLTAKNIEESSNLNRRVGYQGPQDEIGQLATTFDRMIERLNKAFESQKQFVADASHELRTPLTVIQGNLDLLKRNMGEADRQESLRAIESETRRMTKIASDLLLLANLEMAKEVKLESVPLKSLVAEEIKRAQVLAGNRKIVAGKLEEISIKGDIHSLGQVLTNLVDNAVKYTPDGGTITLSVCRDGEWARLDVADTGIGIEAKNIPYLFDRFYRVDKARSRAGGSSGLGLAIVKSIVEQHGGKIAVASEPGEGSTFSVWLKS